MFAGMHVCTDLNVHACVTMCIYSHCHSIMKILLSGIMLYGPSLENLVA